MVAEDPKEPCFWAITFAWPYLGGLLCLHGCHTQTCVRFNEPVVLRLVSCWFFFFVLPWGTQTAYNQRVRFAVLTCLCPCKTIAIERIRHPPNSLLPLCGPSSAPHLHLIVDFWAVSGYRGCKCSCWERWHTHVFAWACTGLFLVGV